MHMRLQRGQALILIALAFLGLVAFIGLTVDAGILFIQIGHLRRAVDAAGLAAASQYLSTTTEPQLIATMKEFLELNGIDPEAASLDPKVCNLSPPSLPQFPGLHDVSLCKENNPWDYDRKLIRVKAELTVNFAFLPVIGLRSVNIKAETIAEAASLDLVLVIDTSQSMAIDSGGFPDCQDPLIHDPPVCQPFEEVRVSAKRFVNQMSFPYDHVSIVNFDVDGYLPQPLTDNKAQILDVIDDLRLGEQSVPDSDDPAGHLSTSIASGLDQAAEALENNGRDTSLWVVVLLSDGAANQARHPETLEYICPGSVGEPTWIKPYCADGDGVTPATRHTYDDDLYDTNDAAMDLADLLGCYQYINDDQSGYCKTFLDNYQPGGLALDGFEALIFTIGMGDKMINGTCDPYARTCYEDLGERVLRYIAAVGDDGNPLSDLCDGKPQKTNCGNYYFAETALDLDPVFTDIAKRVYTRITH